MKRKPTFTTSIGSISGLDPTEDPIGDLAYTLRQLLKKCRVDREVRKAHIALLVQADAVNWEAIPEDDDVMGLLGDLVEALEHYAPPYCYFGKGIEYPCDAGVYGFWPVSDVLEGAEIPRLVAGYDHREHWGADVLLVNDHGNVECGRFDKRGRWHEYWSCV